MASTSTMCYFSAQSQGQIVLRHMRCDEFKLIVSQRAVGTGEPIVSRRALIARTCQEVEQAHIEGTQQ
ncbi:hypothetical protein MD588_02385 [Photobacterium sp. SDRW27]|uniref:hypothetical protein n=1 Tax=Photobacterium obscurum TaxID=2829490 RepID=UPI002242C7C3|nr:hypothetical protein [Photobacterium obscurum]MCW8327649.1 hypothetical protein [Photobacterium obscurum]